MTDADKIAAYQGVLLEALFNNERAEDILRDLRVAPECEGFQTAIDRMEPKMLEVAAELLSVLRKNAHADHPSGGARLRLNDVPFECPVDRSAPLRMPCFPLVGTDLRFEQPIDNANGC